ncbi:ubiquitin-like domain-containing CTD phosphatase 1 isoform X3 [Limulus polyphemus]|nr:ubiquitin-like domain-containing CTD phosphatase 1 isoform X3 [Limulus polyphemus]XP_022249248.1 ubiquitin-like domain-containing CTD phosphatase 1 isoform X3 [Limulus polyphemus]XP_022249249.1 ubiquitin-like domain-containing CTD phosphatase 1 isoform X3 [Limulus polyphemus]
MTDLELTVKWGGKEYLIDCLAGENTIAELKTVICQKTGVLPGRQKLLGLKIKGRPANDEVQLSQLKLKPKTKVLMVGSLEESIADVVAPPYDIPEIVNDLDMEEEEIAIENREEFLAKVQKRIKEYDIKILSNPRPGKKLLVLDIDYTLFDHRSTAQSASELMRPYLHEFLTSAHEDYDIVIWSATSMKWIEVKMKELGVASNPNYKILFYLDSAAMISIHTPKYGLIDVKPLGVIWGKFEQYNSKNTIMFDDIRRNFLMNPHNGLKIKPFREAHLNREKDNELLKLSKYLKHLAAVEDISQVKHKYWESTSTASKVWSSSLRNKLRTSNPRIRSSGTLNVCQRLVQCRGEIRLCA